MRFIRHEPFKLYYKETIQEDIPFQTVSFIWTKQKEKKNDFVPQVSLEDVEQSHLYKAQRPVTKEKKTRNVGFTGLQSTHPPSVFL